MRQSSETRLFTPPTPPAERRLIFHPVVTVLLGIAAGLAYAAWITWRLGGSNLENQYVYVVPIIVPFVSFLFSRAEEWQRLSVAGVAIDLLVVGLSMMRVVATVPFVPVTRYS